ncbi:MAG: ATP-binding protein [Candidatus Cyclobacteriaceae bacterium M2_1C_046]
MKYKYNCSVQCKKEKLKNIRLFVKEKLDGHGLSDLDVSAIVLAVDEICANLIIHSNKCNPDETIILEMEIKDGKEVFFEITDQGEAFDIKQYKEPTIEEIIKAKKKGGIGLLLVKRIMDNVEFTSETDKNTCRLYKKINSH